jgi:serine/threonine protein kinase
MNITKLKGGSLNKTCLYEVGDSKFIRKSISTSANREYGYVRWYSQLKKLQRFDTLFPTLVPRVIDAGVESDGAFFDIEYIPGKDIKTLFVNDEISDVDKLVTELFNSFDTIHQYQYSHNHSSLMLYFMEEVEQKLQDALEFPEFRDFYMMDVYEYKGETFRGMIGQYNKFKKLFNRDITCEGYVHGNPTLENIMYDPETNKITFIDLYEEGIVDSKFMDYSQILQCSNSYYGIINDNPVSVEGNVVSTDVTVPPKLIEFNEKFNSELINRYEPEELELIKLFEATQFFRMLPFKCHAGNITGAKFFYAHACYLVNKLL